MDFSNTVSSFDMLKEKMELADLAVSAGGKWVGKLSYCDMKAMFSINIQL